MRIILSLALLITQCLAHADTLTGRVVRVTDGDTIVILDSSNAQHKIRLTGIDSPERKWVSLGRLHPTQKRRPEGHPVNDGTEATLRSR